MTEELRERLAAEPVEFTLSDDPVLAARSMIYAVFYDRRHHRH